MNALTNAVACAALRQVPEAPDGVVVATDPGVVEGSAVTVTVTAEADTVLVTVAVVAMVAVVVVVDVLVETLP